VNVAALLLVLLSALFHAAWNLLLKRARDRFAFVWWYLLVPMVLFSPLALLGGGEGHGTLKALAVGCGVASGVLQAANLLAMSVAYRTGDLSVAYPLSRGTGQVLTVLLGVGLLGERLAPLGWVGVALVLGGVYVVFLPSWSREALLRPFRLLGHSSSLAALAAGVTIAGYHVIDRVAMADANQFQYILLLFAADFATVTVVLLVRRRWGLVWAEWRANKVSIAVAGSLSLLSYLLVLFALSRERVAYVGPARNVGIVFSVLLGALLLRERHGRMRLLGSALIVAGLALAATGC